MPDLFDSLPRTPEEHFRLYFYAAIVALRAIAPAEALESVLAVYEEELKAAGTRSSARWAAETTAWEKQAGPQDRLPLMDLRAAAGLSHDDLVVLFVVGLVEENPRFGELFEHLQGTGHSRPTLGLIKAVFERQDATPSVRRLRELGLVEVLDPEQPRLAWALGVSSGAWDAMRGEPDPDLGPGVSTAAPDELLGAEDLILASELSQTLARAPEVLASGQARTLILRGRETSGRRTAARAVAKALGLGTIEVAGEPATRPAALGALGALATLLRALPIEIFDPSPGETVQLAPLTGYAGPRAAVIGIHGGVSGALDGALEIPVGLPGVAQRRAHWAQALEADPPEDVVVQYRMTVGHIRATAQLARAQAALAGHDQTESTDIQLGARTLQAQLLDAVAERLGAAEDRDALAVSEETRRELELLEERCRERERLAETGGPALRGQLGVGVRALLSGPSGTGKTLAARLLAGRLGLDAYRLNLASVVNKYLGETEKNLERAFAHAEAANAVLLLDEGDALLTQRTSVQTSNDRYANLETNYLLQRLESFEGILLVTTNAGDRIDAAFRRRLDVIVDFRSPEPRERLRILELHLAPDHRVDVPAMEMIAVRCELTGGQLRNAVLHAELLALEAGEPVGSGMLEEGVRREYRKAGAFCPLPERPVGARA